jgi:hypothetical protein
MYNVNELLMMREDIKRASEYYNITDSLVSAAIDSNKSIESVIREHVKGDSEEINEVVKDTLENFIQDCWDGMELVEAEKYINLYAVNSIGVKVTL